MPPRKKQCCDSAAASTSSAALAPTPLSHCPSLYSASLSQPPHKKLHPHALESIFGHLSFADLRNVTRVSRPWQHAVTTMRPIADGPTVSSTARLDAALQSFLSRHVSIIDVDADTVRRHTMVLTCAHLRRIHTGMPFLRHLGFIPDPSGNGDWDHSAATLFRSTCRLQVNFNSHHSVSFINTFIAWLCRDAPPIRQLGLNWSNVYDEFEESDILDISLQPLRLLTQLRTLYGARNTTTSKQARVGPEFVRPFCSLQSYVICVRSIS
jgi:hypothetical protein